MIVIRKATITIGIAITIVVTRLNGLCTGISRIVVHHQTVTIETIGRRHLPDVETKKTKILKIECPNSKEMLSRYVSTLRRVAV